MKEELVSFDVAVLAKYKGFNWLTSHLYDEKGTLSNYLQLSQNYFINTKIDTWNVSAPTQALLQKWLREEHNIMIEINNHHNYINLWRGRLMSVIFDEGSKNGNLDWDINKDYSTYSEAMNETIREALKLI